ncbi:hypothetical protein BX666DRAFT_452893 [Dichotomocladium elegans]|nr:hypothetical protein BX666DRAFT_452893 [Dichotomocladium elegans]
MHSASALAAVHHRMTSGIKASLLALPTRFFSIILSSFLIITYVLDRFCCRCCCAGHQLYCHSRGRSRTRSKEYSLAHDRDYNEKVEAMNEKKALL